MKQCPACKTTYTDASLRFCLEDGSPLVDLTDEQHTVMRQGGVNPLRIDIPRKDGPKVVLKREPEPRGGTATLLKIAVAVVLLIVAAIAALGLAGAAFYYGSSTAKPEAAPTRTPAPSPTLDDEKQPLKDEIANIQKRLDERKKSSNTDPADDDLHDASVTATVNSPNDGFLALRTEPDADRGTRLAKVPHGHIVEVLNCEKQAISIAGRSGRWCLVEYNGQTGWVFDGFLDY
jgi:SH3 domain-containing protein